MQTSSNTLTKREMLEQLIEDARRQVEDKLHCLTESYLRLEHYRRMLEDLESNEQQRLRDSQVEQAT